MKTKSKPQGFGPVLAPMFACVLLWLIAGHCLGQAPTLVVSAGSTGQAATLTVTSDSQAPWKCFTVTGGSGANNVIWAESNGTTGGIYYGTIATSSSGTAAPGGYPVAPPPPAPSDLPIGTLATAVSAAVTAVDPAALSTLGNSYEALANQIDAGTIVSPLQLQVVTGTQLLTNFTSEQLAGLKNFSTAVAGWIDAQQCAGRLGPDKMNKYSAAYHAIAAAIKPRTAAPAAVTIGGVPPLAKNPCANGQCPKQEAPAWFGRRRR
jgi:hypothetical protein